MRLPVSFVERDRGVDALRFRTQVGSRLFAMAVHTNDSRSSELGLAIVAVDKA